MRRVFLAACILLGVALLALASAFLFREDLARLAAGRFLAGGNLTLTRLEGLQLGSTRLTVDELEFLLHDSAQRLVITGLDVGFRVSSLSAAPEVETVTIASAQLLADAASGDDRGGSAASSGDESGPRLSEILQLLREFPLARIAVNELRIPQRSEALSVELTRGDGALSAQVASGALNLQAQFAQADASGDARFALALTRAAESIGEFTVTLIPVDDVYGIAGEGQLAISDLNALLGELEQAPLPLPLRAAQLDWDLAGTVANDLGGNAGATQTFVLGLQPGSRMTLPAGLAQELGEVTLEFTDRMELTVTSGAGLTLSEGRLPLRIASSWQQQPADVTALLSVADCRLAAAAACAATFDGMASFGSWSLAGRIGANTRGDGRYEIASENLTVGGLPPWLPGFDLQATLDVEDASVGFEARMLLRDAPAPGNIAAEGSYDRASSAASVHVVLPELSFEEQGGALSAWFGAWPFTFDVLTGTIAAEADLAWHDGTLTGTVMGSLAELGGFYGDYFFRGVNGALQAAVDTSAELPIAIPPTTLTVAGFDVGLPMENLQLDFSLDREGVLQIASFSTELLDGTITGANISYDSKRERNDVLVKFDGLQIERMLDLIEYKGVEAKGAVSGEIPLTITPNGVEVADGVLAADAPGGSIRYLGAATGGTGNPGLDLMNQALGNYQFESLTSGIEYTPEGELLLEMKLQGHNPDMQNGQRINLNLNLSDNVPALLESLQAARRIEDFLEEQYTR